MFEDFNESVEGCSHCENVDEMIRGYLVVFVPIYGDETILYTCMRCPWCRTVVFVDMPNYVASHRRLEMSY